ncbi:MAG: hypothetical protein KC561_14340, partial [Myxococcales bacterium]|nr:hypothetical protein [Myxococcales bacterium]
MSDTTHATQAHSTKRRFVSVALAMLATVLVMGAPMQTRAQENNSGGPARIQIPGMSSPSGEDEDENGEQGEEQTEQSENENAEDQGEDE